MVFQAICTLEGMLLTRYSMRPANASTSSLGDLLEHGSCCKLGISDPTKRARGVLFSAPPSYHVVWLLSSHGASLAHNAVNKLSCNQLLTGGTLSTIPPLHCKVTRRRQGDCRATFENSVKYRLLLLRSSLTASWQLLDLWWT
jgi:hypothetical protein